ncbi:MAG: (E)-4-hydroxy-3-methylbut-2-enyl-diphosphate synthase [Candidatus Eisenbacteria bacterium]
MSRRESRPVRVGDDMVIGGGWPIVIQSMTTTSPTELDATLRQIRALVAQGCTLIRLAIPSLRAAEGLAALREALRREALRVALVADVHFNPRLAALAAAQVEKVRINPGNFADGPHEADRELSVLLPLLARRAVALRIGVNQGSLPPHVIAGHGSGPAGMVETAMEYLRLCSARGFHEVVVSLKSSNPAVMIAANRLLADRMAASGIDAPIHLGVTEAGEGPEGALRSAVGISPLLLEGIGDTIRVSLTGDPATEIPVCRDILHGVETAGGIGSAARLAAAEVPAEPVAASWRGVRLGGLHPPRLELALPSRSGAETGATKATRSSRTREIEDLLERLAASVKAEPPIESLLIELCEDPAETTRLLHALRAAGPELAALAVWVNTPLDPTRISVELAREADGFAFALPAGCTRWHASAELPETRSLFSHLARIASRMEQPPLLRWHFTLPDDDDTHGRPTAATIPEHWPALAHDLRRRTADAGCGEAAFSCMGGFQVPFLRRLSAQRTEAGQRPLLVASLPADPWAAAAVIGSLLIDHRLDVLSVLDGPVPAGPARLALARDLLQATRRRLSRAEFISCPGCGRLPLDLAPTVRRLKERLGHLRNVKIAVMGCAVNGPGEMADADFGYVGAGAGRVDLYAGSRRLRQGLTPAQADDALIELLRERGFEV